MPEVDNLNPPIFEAAARRRCLQLARSAIGTTQLLLFGVQSISEVDADERFVPNDPCVVPPAGAGDQGKGPGPGAPRRGEIPEQLSAVSQSHSPAQIAGNILKEWLALEKGRPALIGRSRIISGKLQNDCQFVFSVKVRCASRIQNQG